MWWTTYKKEEWVDITAELPDGGLKSNAAILRFQKMLSTGMIWCVCVCVSLMECNKLVFMDHHNEKCILYTHIPCI